MSKISGDILTKNKNSRFQSWKSNLSKASSSIKNKFGKMFSFGNGATNDLDRELKEYEENLREKATDNYEEDDFEYNYAYDEIPTKDKAFASQKKSKNKEKEGDNYIYLAENGDLHYIDQEGNIYKCREEDGDYILEERISSAKDNQLQNKNEEKNGKNSTNTIDLEKKFEKKEKNRNFHKEEADELNEEEESNSDDNEKDVVFEELLFVKENFNENDDSIPTIHKLRNKGEILNYSGALFKITKPNQKSMKLIQLIKQKLTRYIGVDDTMMYVMSKSHGKYKVRSATSLLSIIKILINESNEKLIKFEISDIHKLEEERTFKVYECEKRGELIKFLKKEFEGYGRSIKVVTFN